MRLRIFWISMALIFLFAATACAKEAPEPTATATPEATATVIPTVTPEPTATPLPTATPDPLGAFFLDIEEPAGLEAIVESSTFTVVGRTRLDAVVSVNDTFAEVDIDGRFRVILTLEEPVNIIEVVASLSSGEELVEIIVIVVSP